MSSTAIEVVGLGKQYRIGAPRAGGQNLRDAIVQAMAAPVRNLRRLREARRSGHGGGSPTIWALRDVSFAVRDGEVLGVIGRNGAGKSTLLKILSRITDPTTGHADVRGRVGSLLEVGTGFHPELSGRDNVFLNGAILGMDRAYIRHRFDEIVEFSGIGSFIDTPVKHYSSGMNVRLAFAVAAHLEPEVLIVDEVLAVGDAEFQQKCLGRMDQVARDGRTVFFVSHNLGAIQRLCTRCILLEEGRLVADTDTAEVVRQYLASGGSQVLPGRWIDLSSAPRGGSGGARLVALRYSSLDPAIDFRAYPGGPLEVALKIRAASPIPRARIGFALRDQYGATLVTASTYAIGSTAPLPPGTSTWVFRLAELSLMPGTYQFSPSVYDSAGILRDRLEPALRLEVLDRQRRAWGPRFDPRYDGVVRCEYQVTAVTDDESSAAESETPDGQPGAPAREPDADRTAV